MDLVSSFESIRDGLLNLDPVRYCENNLYLDGAPLRLNGNGYKPFADIYRYIGVKALERDNSKPVVIVKGRQVGATTMASALEIYFVASGIFGTAGRPPMRIMHCFPQLELVYAYTKTKLNPMISSAVASTGPKKGNKIKSVIEEKLDNTVDANNSLTYKQFSSGNHIWIESTGINGDRIRGRTVDCMFFDEVQDMRKEALGNATKVLSKAQYGLRNNGIQVYFGTPKQSGTEYWRMWRDSTQQYYHLRCESCEEYFPLYTPGSNDWEKIWIDDNLPKDHPSHGFLVQCVHCEHVQDKRPAAERGKWIGLNRDLKEGKEPKFIGFHINQLYMPTFRKWDIIAQKPENHPVNTERAYQNEVLGEFFSGSSAPITAEELYDNCADKERKFTASIGVNATRKVYAGFDWGQKSDLDPGEGKSQGGQSYSCAVILTADGPHMLSVEFATKLKHNDPQTKRDIVEQMFRQYSVGLAVGDVGYANDLTYILQQEHGDKFLGSQATGAVKNHVKFSTDIFPKTIHFERDYYIAELYGKLKKGQIKFPYGDWEKIGWLINHICSMEIKVTQDRSGSLKEHYIKGGTPNDGFMALLNAYLAYKFDITNGFKIINPNQMTTDPTERKKVPAILGYMPRLNRGSQR